MGLTLDQALEINTARRRHHKLHSSGPQFVEDGWMPELPVALPARVSKMPGFDYGLVNICIGLKQLTTESKFP